MQIWPCIFHRLGGFESEWLVFVCTVLDQDRVFACLCLLIPYLELLPLLLGESQ